MISRPHRDLNQHNLPSAFRLLPSNPAPAPAPALWLVVLLLILWPASTASGQATQCSLKLADLPAAPELMGFRMGMTKDQVKARVPQVVFGHSDDFGVSKTTINPDFDPRIDKSTFPGVRSVSLDFLDDRLTSLWIGYDATFKAPTVPEFTKTIAESLHLPDAWTSWHLRGRQMRCADFQLTVNIVSEGPSFRILDQSAEDLIASRREAKAEEESPSETTDESPIIVGDKQSKIYFAPDCKPPKEISAADRVVFATIAEAEKAGFKRAKCQ